MSDLSMREAYSLRDLEDKLKAKGLPEVEDLAEKSYEAFKEWVRESALKSKTPYDDIGIPFISYVDAIVDPAIDGIDGKEG